MFGRPKRGNICEPGPPVHADPCIVVGSMGRVESSGDNAAVEDFFALLRRRVLDRHTCTSRDQLRIATVTLIGRTYRRR